jgi:hypothetical protein
MERVEFGEMNSVYCNLTASGKNILSLVDTMVHRFPSAVLLRWSYALGKAALGWSSGQWGGLLLPGGKTPPSFLPQPPP